MKTKYLIPVLCMLLFFASTCKKTEKEYEPPKVYTNQPLEITNTTALLRGTFSEGLSRNVKAVGFEWKKTTDSTFKKTTVKANGFNFSYTATGLEENTEYNVKSFVIDSYNKVFFGKEMNFFTKGSVTDIDGNIYLTMSYGKKVWMTENLRVTRFADGTPIEARSSGKSDDSDGPVYYHDKWHTSFLSKPNFGLFYNWAAARNAYDCYSIFTIDPNLPHAKQGICPDGWRLPSVQDWDSLIVIYGGKEEAADWMKTANWPDPPYSTYNYSQFSIEPAGNYYWCVVDNIERDFTGTYESAFFWTSNQLSEHGLSFSAVGLQIVYGFSKIESIPMRKTAGYSIRCVKD